MDELVIIVASLSTICISIVFCFLFIKLYEKYKSSDEIKCAIFLTSFYLCASLPIIISGRNLSALNLMDDLSSPGGGALSSIVKLLSYMPILLCIGILYEKLLVPRFGVINGRVNVFFVEISVLLAFALPLILSLFFSSGPIDSFVSRTYGPLILFSAGLFCNIKPSAVIEVIKLCITGIIIISYVFLIIAPNVVMEPYSSGVIPFIPYRFWGVAPHANTFAPLVAILLIIELFYPFKSKLHHWIVMAAAIATLVLCQSKTVWVALTLAMLFIYGLEVSNKVNDKLQRMLIIVSMITCFLALLALFYVNDMSSLESMVFKKEYGGGDFSGRVNIWKQSYLEFTRNPFFGYGPSIWSQEYRLNNGMNYAFHAHNQFFQLIGEYGAIGLMLFCMYICAVLNGIRFITQDFKRIIIAIFILLSIRSISEPTFRTGNAFGGDMMLHLAFYCIFISAFKQGLRSNNMPKLVAH